MEIPALAKARTVVLVEGESDRGAVEVLARRMGRYLEDEGVAVVAMNGVTNAGTFVQRFGPAGLGLSLAGLCDIAEVGFFERALERAGLLSAPNDLESLGFFVCDADLEDELIRATGVTGMQRFIDRQGDLGAFRTFQHQLAQRDRSIDEQLHRFFGTRSGRKRSYARGLAEGLDLTRTPRPLKGLLQSVLGDVLGNFRWK